MYPFLISLLTIVSRPSPSVREVPGPSGRGRSSRALVNFLIWMVWVAMPTHVFRRHGLVQFPSSGPLRSLSLNLHLNPQQPHFTPSVQLSDTTQSCRTNLKHSRHSQRSIPRILNRKKASELNPSIRFACRAQGRGRCRYAFSEPSRSFGFNSCI